MKKRIPITPSPYGGENADPRPLVPLDPLGSYTGRPADPYEKPVQDADDL